MAFKFESLNIWHKALELSVEVDKLARHFPKWEMFNLCSQIRRASDSIALNIAEGCTGQTNPEFKRFLNYAIRSAIEVVSCFFIARRKGYVEEDVFTKYYNDYEVLIKMIPSFRDKIA